MSRFYATRQGMPNNCIPDGVFEGAALEALAKPVYSVIPSVARNPSRV
jgi:hypothetical protein